MCADELYQHAGERVRYVDDQPIFVSTKIEDGAVVVNEIHRRSKLLLHVRWLPPLRFPCCGEPQADRLFGLRMTLPELLEGSSGDHLHSGSYHVTKTVTSSLSRRSGER
jgi:hypothetical protein